MDSAPEFKSKRILIAQSVGFIIVLALAASACASSSDSNDSAQNVEQPSQSESQADTQTGTQPDAESDTQSEPVAEAVPSGAGAYISLAEYQAAKASYASSKVVLFFNATWCSTCKKARSNLEANLSAIPADLAIVLVDFDSETDLKRQYGVTVQHTFVQIDAAGTELAKWSGSLTAAAIVEKTV
ncbi:MAG: thioredoxin family protein [Actinomycetota bacterium]